MTGALKFGGMESFTVKYLPHPKLTFMGTSEKGNTLNTDEAETSCVCQKTLVGLTDLWGKLLVSSNCYLFNQHSYPPLTLANVGLHPSQKAGWAVGQHFYPCVTKEENEIPKV